MRLGGPVPGTMQDAEQWIAALRARGYSAAVFPLTGDVGDDRVEEYRRAAADADIVIAEVGVWNNPLGGDQAAQTAAIRVCQERLALADAVGARCCVNIAGSRGAQWDGPDPNNLTDDTFALIVDTVRTIIDAVRPRRTFYTLEPMPWMYPDSPDAYLRLLAAIDRPQFAVHLDPVNMISSPQRYFQTTAFLEECFTKLGPYIKSCHAKDIQLSGKLTVHLDEVRPGLGNLDYHTFLRLADRLDPDMPLLLEHMSAEEDYREGAAHIRTVAREVGVTMR